MPLSLILRTFAHFMEIAGSSCKETLRQQFMHSWRLFYVNVPLQETTSQFLHEYHVHKHHVIWLFGIPIYSGLTSQYVIVDRLVQFHMMVA